MRNRFTALALIFIALVSTVCESQADSEEQTAEVMDVNVSVISETNEVQEPSEQPVKLEAVTGELTIETVPEEPVTETSVTEPEDKDSEDPAI